MTRWGRWLLGATLVAACSADPPRPAAVGRPARLEGGATRTTPAPVVPADAASANAPDAGAPATLPHTTLRPDDLVDLAQIDPTIRIDMRYAGSDNFTGTTLYPIARCLVRREVAARLARVQSALAVRALGLKVWDCYRPFSVQEALWRRVPDARYVARPVRRAGRPASGSKHNRGAAVDLTLVDAAGVELEMPTPFDDFTPRAHRKSRASAAAETNRATLERAMSAEGFEPLATEWWHFDAPGWRRYDLADLPLDAAAPAR